MPKKHYQVQTQNHFKHSMLDELQKVLWAADFYSLDAGSLSSFGVHFRSESAESDWRGENGERNDRTDYSTRSYISAVFTNMIYVTSTKADADINAGTTSAVITFWGLAVRSWPSNLTLILKFAFSIYFASVDVFSSFFMNTIATNSSAVCSY